MREIRELITDIMKGVGMGGVDDLAVIRNAWVGSDALPAYAEPYRLEDGRLYVRVESHAWAQELSYVIGRVKDEIEKSTGIKISEIIIKVNVK